MKKLFMVTILGVALTGCGSKGSNKAELTPEQEIQSVDSAAQQTNDRIDEIGNSVSDLKNEVDSLLNE